MRLEAGWALAVVMSCSVPAWAESPTTGKPAALSWVRLPGAERCPDVRALAAQVALHLHRSAFVATSQAQLLIEAYAEPTPSNAWKIRIALSDDAGTLLGTRELQIEKTDCTEVIDAAALAIALMIDPDAALRAGPPAAEVDQERTTATEPMPTATPSEPKPPRKPAPAGDSNVAGCGPAPWHLRLSFGGTVALGLLPGAAPGMFGALRLSAPNRAWGFDLVGSYLPAQTAEIPSSNGHGSFSLTSVDLLGWLLVWQRGPLALALAAGAEAGSVRGFADGFTAANYDAQSWLLSVRLEMELNWRFAPHWTLLLRPGLGVPFWHDSFDATVGGQASTVFEPSSVAGSFALGAGVEF